MLKQEKPEKTFETRYLWEESPFLVVTCKHLARLIFFFQNTTPQIRAIANKALETPSLLSLLVTGSTEPDSRRGHCAVRDPDSSMDTNLQLLGLPGPPSVPAASLQNPPPG